MGIIIIVAAIVAFCMFSACEKVEAKHDTIDACGMNFGEVY